MNLRYVVSCGLVGAALLLTGCDEGRVAPGKVTVRVANAVPSYTALDYQREQPRQVQPSTLGYKNTVNQSYDADTYDFFVYERLPQGSTLERRSWTFSRTLTSDLEYTFVLTDVGEGEVQPIIVEYPAAPPTDVRIIGLHAAPGLPAMDLYLERPGVGIAGATRRGTFSLYEQIPPTTIAGGEYELWLTEANNPANVLLATAPFSLTAATTSTIVVVPEPGAVGAQLSVIFVQPEPIGLYDRNVTGTLRVINGATDMAPRDFAINSQFSPPLFSAIPFAEPTTDETVSTASQTINVTPVGNQGVLELNSTFQPGAALRSTLLFSGPAGTLVHTATADDGRRIQNEARLLMGSAATQFTAVDFVLTLPGVDPTMVSAVDRLAAPGLSIGYTAIPPGDYDFYLRDGVTGAMLSGATRITMAGGGIYGVLATNGPDTATAVPVFFDDFP
jgi:hypothetical protein